MSENNEQRYVQLMKVASQKIADLQSEIERLKQKEREPIAIVGMSCRLAEADNPEAFWDLLANGVDAIREAPKGHHSYLDPYYDPDPDVPGKVYIRRAGFLNQSPTDFDASFFGISAREAASLDPQHRLVMEVAWEALENAGFVPEKLAGSQTGVFMGICANDYVWQLVKQDPVETDFYIGSGNAYSPVAGRLSYFFDFTGPCLAVDTGCASSLAAIHLAVTNLRRGDCNLALAGGVQRYVSPEYWLNLCKSRMLSPDGRCKTFAAGANGYARGEGCGIIVLKRLSDAVADGDNILALIRGTAHGQDGRTSGLTVPSGSSQQNVIRRAIANAGIKPKDVNYIEAHGTGTSLGDPIEANALIKVFRQREEPLILGSAKTNIGHLEGAAGVAGLIKIVLSLQNELIPQHLHFQEPSPYIAWDEMPIKVASEQIPWPATDKTRFAGVSSFGFTGINVHAVLSEAPPVATKSEAETWKRPLHLLTLSAKTKPALEQMVRNYEKHLATHPNLEWADICYTTNTRRTHFHERLAVVADSVSQAREKLLANLAGTENTNLFKGSKSESQPQIAFLFTGQGSQYLGMGRELYETQPIFRQALDRCQEILNAIGNQEKSLLSVLYQSDDSSLLEQTAYTQPALFALEYALASMWKSWGLEPTAVIGHSVGEYAAACVAGIFSLEDGLKLIAARGHLMQKLPDNGEMVSLLASVEQVTEAIKGTDLVSIAAINGPESVVISGEREAVHLVVQKLEHKGIKTKRLKVSHAFHSALMKPMLAEFRQVVQEVTFHQPKLNFISNVTGNFERVLPTDPEYWVDHVVKPVRFADGVETLHREGVEIFVEMGPQPILLGMARHCLPSEYGTWLPTLQREQSDWQGVLQAVGQLYVRGVAIDWEGFHRDYGYRQVGVPTYPWQRERYWIDVTHTQPLTQSGSQSVAHSLLGQPSPQQATGKDFADQVVWKPQPRYGLPADYLASPSELTRNKEDQPLARNWLIFADDHGVAQQLATEMKTKGDLPTVVFPTESLHPLGTETASPLAKYQDLITDQKWHGVVHLGNLDSPGNELDVNLVKSLVKSGSSPRFWLVTQGVQAIEAAQTDLVRSHLWEISQVIQSEPDHPELSFVLLNLAPEGVDNRVQTILDEIWIEPASSVKLVAFRDKERLVAQLVNPEKSGTEGILKQKGREETSLNLVEQLKATEKEQRKALLIAHIQSLLSQVLGDKQERTFSLSQGFLDLGMDSMTSIELRNRLQNSIGIPLSSTLFYKYPTPEALVDYLIQDVLATFVKFDD